jgi:hypothetical protein
MHTRRGLSRLGRRRALSRPVYKVATTSVASLHHVAIEYTGLVWTLSDIGVTAKSKMATINWSTYEITQYLSFYILDSNEIPNATPRTTYSSWKAVLLQVKYKNICCFMRVTRAINNIYKLISFLRLIQGITMV